MKKLSMNFIMICFLLLGGQQIQASGNRSEVSAGWKAGIARVVITPEQSMWMAGYALRDHPSEGKMHDLWAKAIVLEDESGKKAVLVTTDLLGFPKGMSDRIRDRIHTKYGFSRDQIILSSSHTHSGPVLQSALYDIYPLDGAQLELIKKYSDNLEDQIVTLVGNGLKSMKPVSLFARNGVSRFQVNRRTNIDAGLDQQIDLNGPNDYAVPVIKLVNETGDLIAVVFGYACHATVLDGYQWSGDYPGFAQLALEKMHPGVTALFFQGAGADMNPIPRRSVPLAQQYGEELAASVERVLNEEMRKLPPHLSTAYSEVELSFTSPPTKEALLRMEQESSGFEKQWAIRMLDQISRGEPFISSYLYPVEVWKIGDQPLVCLGGELVVEYAIQLKRIFGQELFVMGYSNDVMTYIPSVRILREGGYEGAVAQIVYGLPSTWKADTELNIMHEVLKLADQTGIQQPESKLVKY
jgi:neutral ceramidase